MSLVTVLPGLIDRYEILFILGLGLSAILRLLKWSRKWEKEFLRLKCKENVYFCSLRAIKRRSKCAPP